MFKNALIAVIVGIAFFMQNLDSTVVTTALPQMARSFHVSPVALSMVITTYVLAVAVFTPISGWIADRFGSSTVFQLALGAFTLGSLLCAIADSVPLLVLARILQGIGGAMTIPVGRTVMLRTVPKSEWIRVLTYLQVAAQLGFMVGPLVGGLIATYISWRWIFLINLPVGVVGIVLARLFIENHREPDRTPLDWLGFVLTGIAFSAIMYTIESVAHRLASGWMILLYLAIGIGFSAASIWHSKRHPYPLINLNLFRLQTFTVNLSGGSLFRISWGAMPFLLPLLFQVIFGKTALQSGLLTFPTAIGSLAVQFLAAWIYRTFGFRKFLLVNGMLCGFIILSCALITGATPAALIFVLLTIWGFVMALQFNALNSMAYADLEPQEISVGSGMAQLFQQFSGGMGVAVAALVLQMSLAWHGTEQLTNADFRVAFTVGSLVCFTSLLFYLNLGKNAGAEVSGHKLQ